MTTASRLADALAAVRAAGTAAGLALSEIEEEASAVAAGVCGDPSEWADAFDKDKQRFADAAKAAHPWDRRPTPLLEKLLSDGRLEEAKAYAIALAGIAIEASSLDPDPSLKSINAAGRVARTQLDAARATPAPVVTADTPEAPAVATPVQEPLPTLAELLAKLDALIGLKGVKEQVHRQVALLRVNQLRTEKGLKAADISRHLVFVGNPGTGKTTVARLVAQIYRALGILEKGTLVETDRSGLVAGYLGQTAMKTAEVITKALGGLLFIDEAYALVGDQYSDEAVAALVKGMEDHRDDLVVIVAGYPGEMEYFIAQNPGLESRFATTITFPDYSEDELVEIFEMFCRESDFEPTDGCIAKLRKLIQAEPRDKGFGNGRLVRNLFEAALGHQAWRLREKESPTVEELRQLRADDLPETTAEAVTAQ